MIKCENVCKFSIFSQIEIKDSIVQKHSISNFEFLPSPLENLDSFTKEMLIGYRNGMILHINHMDNSILNKFNIIDYEEGDKFIAVQTILISPKNPSIFYVLFLNGLLMQYTLEKTEENLSFLEEKSRIVERKKGNSKNKGKPLPKENNFEIKNNKFEDMQELNFVCGKNLDKFAKNPLNFFFFNCAAISDAIFQKNNFFKKYGYEFIFAFVGYDGFFRIYDLETRKPLFSFKSNYGGLNHISFNKTGDLVALAGHDDNVVILNLANYSYLTIEGHKSFITKVVLTDIDEKFLRVFASSMDGTISITDINTLEIGFKTLTDSQIGEKRKFPIKVIFSDFRCKRVLAKNINLGNFEGVGSIIFHEPHLIAAGFDGSVTIWNVDFEKEKKIEKESTEEELENGEKKNDNDNKEERNHENENKKDSGKKNKYPHNSYKNAQSNDNGDKMGTSESGKKKNYNQK